MFIKQLQINLNREYKHELIGTNICRADSENSWLVLSNNVLYPVISLLRIDVYLYSPDGAVVKNPVMTDCNTIRIIYYRDISGYQNISLKLYVCVNMAVHSFQ